MTPTAANNQRALLKSDQRQAECVRLFFQHGLSMRAVGRELGISVVTVGKDLVRARRAWVKENAKTYDELLPVKLAEINVMREQAWIGWRRSLEDKVKTKKNKDGVVVEETREGQSGNPAHLGQLERLLRLECELRGMLDREVPTIEANNVAVVEVVIESREQKEEFDQTFSYDAFKERARISAG